MKKVSTIISVYNGDKYLEQAIQSILNQTHENIEIILIDDCSSDCSREIISKYKDDNRFIIRYNEFNLGLNKNIQIGVELATGDYICFLDQDDLFINTKFENQIKYLEKTGYDGVYSSTQEIDKDGNLREIQPNLDNFEKLYNTDKQKLFWAICTAPADIYLPMSQSSMFKSAVIKELNKIRSKLFLNDWPILIKAFEEYNIGFMNEITFQLRVHEESATKNINWNKSITLQSTVMTVPEEYQDEVFSNYFNYTGTEFFNIKDYKNASRMLLISLLFKFKKDRLKLFKKSLRRYIKQKIKSLWRQNQ